MLPLIAQQTLVLLSRQILIYGLEYLNGQIQENLALGSYELLQKLLVASRAGRLRLAVQDWVVSNVDLENGPGSHRFQLWESLKEDLKAANVDFLPEEFLAEVLDASPTIYELRGVSDFIAHRKEPILLAAKLPQLYRIELKGRDFSSIDRNHLKKALDVQALERLLLNSSAVVAPRSDELVRAAKAKDKDKGNEQKNAGSAVAQLLRPTSAKPAANSSRIVSSALQPVPQTNAAVQALVRWSGNSAIAQFSSVLVGLLLFRLLWLVRQAQPENGLSLNWAGTERNAEAGSLLGWLGNSVEQLILQGEQLFDEGLAELQAAVEQVDLQNLKQFSPLLQGLDDAAEVVTQGVLKPSQSFIAELFDGDRTEAIAPGTLGSLSPLLTLLNAVDVVATIGGQAGKEIFFQPTFMLAKKPFISVGTATLLPSGVGPSATTATAFIELPSSSAHSSIFAHFDFDLTRDATSGSHGITSIINGLDLPSSASTTGSEQIKTLAPTSIETAASSGMSLAEEGGIGEPPGESGLDNEEPSDGGLPLPTGDLKQPLEDVPVGEITTPATPSEPSAGQVGTQNPAESSDVFSDSPDFESELTVPRAPTPGQTSAPILVDAAGGSTVMEIHEPEAGMGADGQAVAGEMEWGISNFGGVGTGTSPSAETIAEVDTLKFASSTFGPEKLNLLQMDDDLLLTFAHGPAVQIRLIDFELENLDNLVASSATATVGNVLFGDDASIGDRIDVFNRDWTLSRVLNPNTVTFLNDLDNSVRGVSSADNVINGQDGHDKLIGGHKNDLLRGDSGDDSLNGGRGNNWLVGGDGNDLFHMGQKGITVVEDFNPLADKLALTTGVEFSDLSWQSSAIPEFSILGFSSHSANLSDIGTLITADAQAFLMLPGFSPDQVDASWFVSL